MPYAVFSSKLPKSGALALFLDDDFALGALDIHDDFTNFGNLNMPGHGILDADDWGGERGLHVGTLKGKIGIHHFAVYELQIFAIAKRLSPDDPAIFKGDVFTVPRKILTFHDTVPHRDIFCVPERILGVEYTVFKHGIRDVLEGVFAFHTNVAESQVIGAKHKVFALNRAVLHVDPAHRPAELRGNDVAATQFGISALPQRLDAGQLACIRVHLGLQQPVDGHRRGAAGLRSEEQKR